MALVSTGGSSGIDVSSLSYKDAIGVIRKADRPTTLSFKPSTSPAAASELTLQSAQPRQLPQPGQQAQQAPQQPDAMDTGVESLLGFAGSPGSAAAAAQENAAPAAGPAMPPPPPPPATATVAPAVPPADPMAPLVVNAPAAAVSARTGVRGRAKNTTVRYDPEKAKAEEKAAKELKQKASKRANQAESAVPVLAKAGVAYTAEEDETPSEIATKVQPEPPAALRILQRPLSRTSHVLLF